MSICRFPCGRRMHQPANGLRCCAAPSDHGSDGSKVGALLRSAVGSRIRREQGGRAATQRRRITDPTGARRPRCCAMPSHHGSDGSKGGSLLHCAFPSRIDASKMGWLLRYAFPSRIRREQGGSLLRCAFPSRIRRVRSGLTAALCLPFTDRREQGGLTAALCLPITDRRVQGGLAAAQYLPITDPTGAGGRESEGAGQPQGRWADRQDIFHKSTTSLRPLCAVS